MPIATPLPGPWGSAVLPPKWQLSVWQESTRDDPLVNHGRDDPLPEASEVVIIGSGLAGASLAYNLLSSPQRPSTVTVLEARECCSGASGRNAGHCRPDAYRGYNAYAKTHGEVEAAKILKSEQTTLERVDAFIREHQIDCEWTPRPTLDVCLSEDFATYASDAFEAAKRGGVNLSHVKPYEQDEAKRITRSPMAEKAFDWPAATLNPAKLCYGVHRVNQSFEGYSLFTHTPVTSVTKGSTWLVNTPRGSILADKVVYATNAYTKLLVPDFDGLIQPYQAQAIKLDPPVDSFGKLEASLSLRYELHRFYSVAQRPDRSIILGSTRVWPGQTPEEKAATYDTMDDSLPGHHERARHSFEAFNRIIHGTGYKPASEGSDLVQGQGGYAYHWSGIIGMTPDSTPFVGALPGHEGQYILAGFNGHGMARIFHCSPNLANVMIHGESAWENDFPDAFKVSETRLSHLRALVQSRGKIQANANAEATKLVV